jgi:ribokinase
MTLDAIGFGALNIDEFWEVDRDFLERHGLDPGSEYVRDSESFAFIYPDLNKSGKRQTAGPGGSAANTIAALAKMGFNTGFYGAAGRGDFPYLDELGERANLRIFPAEKPSGRCLSFLIKGDPGRDRTMIISPNANDCLSLADPEPEYFQAGRRLHLSSFVSVQVLDLQTAVVAQLAEKTQVSFDPGILYSRLGAGRLEPILKHTNILFTTAEELSELTGANSIPQAVSSLQSMGVLNVFVKLGAEGIRFFDGERELFQSAVKTSQLIDRTGAGDVAAAGFLAGNLKGFDTGKSLYMAAAAASKSLEGFGREAYPTKEFFEKTAAEFDKLSTQK